MSNYKPLLANRLTFPENWQCIVIYILPDSAHWEAFLNGERAELFYKRNDWFQGSRIWLFTDWDAVLDAMNGAENENRQFHVMVDLISWHLKPLQPGTAHGLDKGQTELPF